MQPNRTAFVALGTLGIILLSGACTLQAELSWDSRAIETKAEAGAKTALQIYEIKNTGKKPIRFQRLEANCPCISLTTKEKILAPGQSSQIVAHFDIGDRIGRQRKHLTLYTDDSRDSVVSWVWTINIPEIIRLQPAFLYWELGSKPLPQKAEIELVMTEAKIKGWKLEGKGFQAEVKEGKPGFLTIHVTPETSSTALLDRLLIEVLLPDKTTRFYPLRLLVK